MNETARTFQVHEEICLISFMRMRSVQEMTLEAQVKLLHWASITDGDSC